MSSAVCGRWAGSGASGIDASVSLPLCRERGAMVAALPWMQLGAALRDLDALGGIRVSARQAGVSCAGWRCLGDGRASRGWDFVTGRTNGPGMTVEDGWVLCRVRISEVEEPQKGPNRVPSQSQPPPGGGD